MRLLLDTVVVVWVLDDSSRLGPQARQAIQDADEVYFSAATPWELAIKRNAGKLDVTSDVADVLVRDGYLELPIESAHGEAAGRLPLHHRDPFDRILVAQARLEHLTIATVDPWFDRYDVPLLDASL